MVVTVTPPLDTRLGPGTPHLLPTGPVTMMLLLKGGIGVTECVVTGGGEEFMC